MPAATRAARSRGFWHGAWTYQIALGEKDVGGLDVAMQHALGVHKLERHADLTHGRAERRKAAVGSRGGMRRRINARSEVRG